MEWKLWADETPEYGHLFLAGSVGEWENDYEIMFIGDIGIIKNDKDKYGEIVVFNRSYDQHFDISDFEKKYPFWMYLPELPEIIANN